MVADNTSASTSALDCALLTQKQFIQAWAIPLWNHSLKWHDVIIVKHWPQSPPARIVQALIKHKRDETNLLQLKLHKQFNQPSWCLQVVSVSATCFLFFLLMLSRVWFKVSALDHLQSFWSHCSVCSLLCIVSFLSSPLLLNAFTFLF
jgi:hypothetical protein